MRIGIVVVCTENALARRLCLVQQNMISENPVTFWGLPCASQALRKNFVSLWDVFGK
jgi:hypothetical protein